MSNKLFEAFYWMEADTSTRSSLEQVSRSLIMVVRIYIVQIPRSHLFCVICNRGSCLVRTAYHIDTCDPPISY